jgi:hypothetical protein
MEFQGEGGEAKEVKGQLLAEIVSPGTDAGATVRVREQEVPDNVHPEGQE